MFTLKKLVVHLKCLISIVLLRNYGNIIHDLAHKYKGKVSLSDFRSLEKLSTKKRKADLDVNFLRDCQSFEVFPKFICFPLPNVNAQDVHAIRKRLLRSAVLKRSKEKRKLENDMDKISSKLKAILNTVDWHILQKALAKTITKKINTLLCNHRKKLKNLTRNKTLPFTHRETVTNLSSHKLKPDELDLLKNGLYFSIRPPRLNDTEILATFERIHYTIQNKLQNQEDYIHVKNELIHIAQSYISSYTPSPSDLKKHRILKDIRNNKNIILLKPDKGNGVVIMDREVYNSSCLKIISDKSKFKLLDKDPTLSREAKLQRLLRKLKKQGSIDNNTYSKIFPSGSQPARFYGLPKLHKHVDHSTPPPLRPIVSSINSYNYKLSKYLCSLLSPLVPNDYTTKDSFTFVDELNNQDINSKYIVSFDVKSLFTNIPLTETIDIALDLLFTQQPNFHINRYDLKQLFNIATSQTHFLFNEHFYDQTDGVAMGSPLAPVLANLFMGYHEKNWLTNYDGSNVLFYRRYVDDIFCIFDNENDASLFLNYLNLQHTNITFTVEKEHDNKLPFLDILITKDTTSDKCITSVFHKKTYTGLLMNFFSFTPRNYKTGLIKTLLERIHRINNTTNGCENDINTLIETLKRNSFPVHFIDKVIQSFNDKIQSDTQASDEPNQNKPNIYYFKLPYIGSYSHTTQQKLRKLTKRFCVDLKIKLVFSSYKIKNLFSFKNSIPSLLKSCVVYEFSCAGCNSRYVGETTRHLSTRIKEHTHSDKNSHIYKHLHTSPHCKSKYNHSCFRILDTANSPFSLKLKEALYIQKLKPDLNKQIYHINTIFNL